MSPNLDSSYAPDQYLLEKRLANPRPSPTPGRLLESLLRYWRLLLLSFICMFSGAVLVSFVLPPSYEAHLKILVKNQRIDPVVSPSDTTSPWISLRTVDTEEVLNSEAQLLQSSDLLYRVVVQNRLYPNSRLPFAAREADTITIARGVKRLASGLKIEPLKKSNIIDVSYSNSDPVIAASVLNNLADFYIDKHLEVYHDRGQYALFAKLADDYNKQLMDAEAKLSNSGTVAPSLMRDLVVQKYNDFKGKLDDIRSNIKETEQRLSMLQAQEEKTPARVLTQTRKLDNQQLLQQLKGTLLTLELKRDELLTKFQPGYQPVVEIESQIADTRATIAKEESEPAQDQTTDENPTRVWINSEVAKAGAELAGLKARAASMEPIVESYRLDAQQFEKRSMDEKDLDRIAKTAEDNYRMYARKAEEAEISEELDRKRILNVAIAERAAPPALPTHSRLEYLMVGFVLSILGAVSVVFATAFLNPAYHSADDVRVMLQLPVFATVSLDGPADNHALHGVRALDLGTGTE
jgi:uncharacterized protein involved in exopolysaccharide biosynthesis